MEAITGVFETEQQAVNVVQQLRNLGLTEDQIGYVTPTRKSGGTTTKVRVTDSEDSGMGMAMGGAVGGAMGAATGATLGLAAASLIVPGVGPVIAFGLLGAALVGGAGAALGAEIGDTIEENLGEGLPHEDIYLYEDALRHGSSIVIVHANGGKQTDDVRDLLKHSGAIDQETLKENWWAELRDQELTDYQSTGRDFQSDEQSYRKGFEAAQHAKLRGKSYAECEASLRERYADNDLDNAFRRGYARGQDYQTTCEENRTG